MSDKKKPMEKKVIEQENTKSGVAICHFDKIITLHSGQDLSENHSVFVINKDEATEVAKAIDPEYQRIEQDLKIYQAGSKIVGKELNELKVKNAKLVEALKECQVTISEIKSEDSEYNSKVFELYRRNNLLIIQALQNTKT